MCLPLDMCLNVLFFEVQKFNLSLTLGLNYTKTTRSRLGLVSCPFKSWFYVWHKVETYIKGTYWKRCYLVTSSRLINVYFTNQYHFCWYQQKLKSGKVASFIFFQVNFLLKQPFADVFQSRCSKKLRNIHRKTPALESLLNEVPVLQTCYFKSNPSEGAFLWILQNF